MGVGWGCTIRALRPAQRPPVSLLPRVTALRTPLREQRHVPFSFRPPAPAISRGRGVNARLADAPAHCSRCDAVCCRLTVVLLPGDEIPLHLTDVTDAGLAVMARDEDGWCVAIDSARMCCSIYETRPQICRRFTMGGPYCEAVREDYTRFYPRDIALTLV